MGDQPAYPPGAGTYQEFVAAGNVPPSYETVRSSQAAARPILRPPAPTMRSMPEMRTRGKRPTRAPRGVHPGDAGAGQAQEGGAAAAVLDGAARKEAQERLAAAQEELGDGAVGGRGEPKDEQDKEEVEEEVEEEETPDARQDEMPVRADPRGRWPSAVPRSTPTHAGADGKTWKWGQKQVRSKQ